MIDFYFKTYKYKRLFAKSKHSKRIELRIIVKITCYYIWQDNKYWILPIGTKHKVIEKSQQKLMQIVFR